MKNDKWLDLTNGVCWSMIFSLAAIITSIVAMAHKCPRIYGQEHLGFDYLGVIVGILAILVTFLVAWQIWATLKSDEKIKNFENELKRQDAQMKLYVDNEVKKERQTREFGILFQAALKTIEEKRYLDAVKAMCMIVNITDMESFIQGAAHHIHVIIRDHQDKLGDKEELRDDLEAASEKFKKIGITCKMVVETINNYLTTKHS